MEISVIMSVYNGEKFVRKCIESILNQTFTRFEFIIIDDGSTDNTKNIIKEYEKKDERIILIENETNQGLTKNLNKALSIAKGEYIARMDADDISTKDRLQTEYEYLKKHKEITVVSCIGQYIDENDNLEEVKYMPESNEEIVAMMHKVNPILHPGVMFRKKEIEEIGNYDERYKVVQDYNLWFRCMKEGYKFYNIQKILLYFRRDKSYNKRKSKKYRKVDIKVRIEGYRLNKISLYKRIYIIIPIMLYILPSSFIDKFFYVFKKNDPRNKKKKNI